MKEEMDCKKEENHSLERFFFSCGIVIFDRVC